MALRPAVGGGRRRHVPVRAAGLGRPAALELRTARSRAIEPPTAAVTPPVRRFPQAVPEPLP